jgi:hypothetical protein
MSRLTKNLLWISLFLTYNTAIGQISSEESSQNSNWTVEDITDASYRNIEEKLFSKYANIDGSPFLFKKFQEGTVKTTKGKSFELNINYDNYSDLVISELNGQQVVIDNNYIDTFTIDNKSFVFLGGLGYVEEMAKGAINLYKKYIATVETVAAPSGYHGATASDKFDQEEILYYEYEEELKEFPGKKKDVIALLTSIDSSIEKTLKEQKLNVNKEEDLISAIGLLK